MSGGSMLSCETGRRLAHVPLRPSQRHSRWSTTAGSTRAEVILRAVWSRVASCRRRITSSCRQTNQALLAFLRRERSGLRTAGT